MIKRIFAGEAGEVLCAPGRPGVRLAVGMDSQETKRPRCLTGAFSLACLQRPRRPRLAPRLLPPHRRTRRRGAAAHVAFVVVFENEIEPRRARLGQLKIHAITPSHPRTREKRRSPVRRRAPSLVGVAGFEPATSRPQTSSGDFRPYPRMSVTRFVMRFFATRAFRPRPQLYLISRAIDSDRMNTPYNSTSSGS